MFKQECDNSFALFLAIDPARKSKFEMPHLCHYSRIYTSSFILSYVFAFGQKVVWLASLGIRIVPINPISLSSQGDRGSLGIPRNSK